MFSLLEITIIFKPNSIFIVSRTKRGNAYRRECWGFKVLEQNGVFSVLGIPVSNVQFVTGFSGESGKGPWAKHFAATHIVDDKRCHLESCSKYTQDTLHKRGLLRFVPFSREIGEDYREDIVRIPSFSALATHLDMNPEHYKAAKELINPVSTVSNFRTLNEILRERLNAGTLGSVDRGKVVSMRQAVANVAKDISNHRSRRVDQQRICNSTAGRNTPDESYVSTHWSPVEVDLDTFVFNLRDEDVREKAPPATPRTRHVPDEAHASWWGSAFPWDQCGGPYWLTQSTNAPAPSSSWPHIPDEAHASWWGSTIVWDQCGGSSWLTQSTNASAPSSSWLPQNTDHEMEGRACDQGGQRAARRRHIDTDWTKSDKNKRRREQREQQAKASGKNSYSEMKQEQREADNGQRPQYRDRNRTT